ncbi:hypothetical protein BBJ28_00015255 [Nothophytophthora sp. Chile5]|nr:hypothetical protein BBJ28_00015255 [Nothophytophthora sp. Chile5]
MDEEVHRNMRTPDERSKKKRKEAKKHKKHKKHKLEREETPDEDESETAAQSSVPATAEPRAARDADKPVDEQPQRAAPVDVKSFFEQLKAQEAGKAAVGTVHARGDPAPVSATALSASDKWECSKPGCGHLNSKHAPACNKCGAMKRLTEWR